MYHYMHGALGKTQDRQARSLSPGNIIEPL